MTFENGHRGMGYYGCFCFRWSCWNVWVKKVKIVENSGKELEMDIINELFIDAINLIKILTGEQIALLSVAVSFVLYLLSKRSEIKLKKYEAKKEEYAKFLTWIIKFFTEVKDMNLDNKDPKPRKGKTNQKSPTDKALEEFEKNFYEAGSSFAVYASKELYDEFLFFRKITTDEKVKELKYFDNTLVLYSLGRMVRIIRKEAGLNKSKIAIPQILAFAINDITKPQYLVEYEKLNFNRMMIKFYIIGSNIRSFYWIKSVWYSILKPMVVITSLTIAYTIYLILSRTWGVTKSHPVIIILIIVFILAYWFLMMKNNL